ncbi:MAG: hypothetical protein HDT22_08910 [Ruminococcus sp.]|nr:hypothetical protein [Ruminococcus sp.]
MLSKVNIEKQIGKGINIVPFKRDNIKENSINFTISDKAWTLIPKNTGNGYNNAKPACKSGILTLEPHSTTIIYTEEVIALNNKLGGTFHAKVGIVSKGVIFSSTMIGPSYCGHLMISLQNSTDTKIKLKVGDTFISLVLHKLDTKINKSLTNSNTGGHTGKLTDLNIHPSNNEQKFLDEDWKKNIVSIRNKLKDEADYNSLHTEINKRRYKYYTFLGILFLIILAISYFVLSKFIFDEDSKSIIGSMAFALIIELITIVTGILKKILNIDI